MDECDLGMEGIGMAVRLSWYISLYGLIFFFLTIETFSICKTKSKDEEKQTLKLNTHRNK